MEYRKESVRGFDEYSVDTNGVVYGKKGRPLKYNVNRHGYRYVVLLKNGVAKTMDIHRIVAKQFVEPVEGKGYVNHLDGDKTNNHVENLEWVTAQENSRHAADILKRGVGGNNYFAKKVRGVNPKTGEVIVSFDSIADAGRYYAGLDGGDDKRKKTYVWRALSGRRKTYNNLRWEYDE